MDNDANQTNTEWWQMMKKIITLVLCALMLLIFCRCGSAKTTTDSGKPEAEMAEAESPEAEISEAQDTAEAANVAGPRVGGWSNSADPAVTDEQRAVFDKALKGLLGVNYEPVAYLGSQIVAGTNHCFLCQAKAVVPDAEPYYVLIYIYEDLSGDAQIMNIADFDIGAFCEYGAAAKEN